MSKYIIDNRYITPFFSDTFKYAPQTTEEKKYFEKNGTYYLMGLECDGFPMPIRKYQCVGVLNEIDGVELNSVIMKQISGEPTTIFSLTKSDCKNFGIDFESGLQLFPNNLNWVKEGEAKNEPINTYDSSNLSTYPVDYHDKTIHYMIVKISGFAYNEQFHAIVTPNGELIDESDFIRSLSVKTRRNIGLPHNLNDVFINTNEYISYRIITNHASRVGQGKGLVDLGGCVFLELILERRLNNSMLGVKPQYFMNQGFDSFFTIELNIRRNRISDIFANQQQAMFMNTLMEECDLNSRYRYGLKKDFDNNNDIYWVVNSSLKF